MAEHHSAPSILQVEMCAIGSAMLSADASRGLARMLEPSDFYGAAHGLIFAAISRLAASGAPAELVSVKNALEDAKTLQDAGGVPYLCAVAESAASPASWKHYGERIKEHSRKRQFAVRAELIADAARNGKSADDLYRMALELPAGLGPQSHIARSVAEAEDWEPDFLIDPYLVRGTFADVVGPEGSGKTSMILALANAGAAGYFPGANSVRPYRALVFSREQIDREVRWKMEKMGLEHPTNVVFVPGWMLDAQGLAKLSAYLKDGAFDLFIADPIRIYLPIRSLIDNVGTALALGAYAEMLRASNVVGINIRHPKQHFGQIDIRERGAGCQDWLSMARAGWWLAVHPESTKHHLRVGVIHTRGNFYGGHLEPFGFEIKQGRFSWIEKIDPEDYEPKPKEGRKTRTYDTPKLSKAIEVLSGMVQGPNGCPNWSAKEAVIASGCSERTFADAKREMGLKYVAGRLYAKDADPFDDSSVYRGGE